VFNADKKSFYFWKSVIFENWVFKFIKSENLKILKFCKNKTFCLKMLKLEKN